jgi:pimeloyl-ACP methyl ester carboxylesterase
MASVTRLDKQTNTEISINYELIGDGEEVIVFHHGNGNCIRDWHTLGFVAALKQDFRLLLIDSRGYGLSSKPHEPSAYSLKSRAEDTMSVLNQEKIESAHCLGASIGASICFLLAKFYPERFKSYIFATPYFTLFDDEIKTALADSVESYVAKLEVLLGGRISNEDIRNTFLANDAKAVLAANAAEWFDYLDFIQYVKAPSLIYVGDKEPSVPALVVLSDKLKATSGHLSYLRILPDMDHVKAYWDSDVTTPLIRAFINRI